MPMHRIAWRGQDAEEGGEMSTSARPVLVAPDDPKATKPSGCERCKANAKVLKELRATVRELTEQNERLLRAVQRESYLIDKRAGHDGSRYLKQKKED